MSEYITVMADVDLANDKDEAYAVGKVLETAAYYCRLTGSAKECRLQGRVDDALQLERKAESIYSSLPDWAKW